MRYWLYGVFVYIVLMGGSTGLNCATLRRGPAERGISKFLGALQMISGLCFGVALNLLFTEKNGLYWALLVATVLLLIFGTINIALYAISNHL